MSEIEIKGLSRVFERFSLRDINLRIERNEYLVILGPSGCGKTTLLECLAGVHALDAGEIRVNGEDVAKLPIEKRGIGFVYQTLMLFPHLTVSGNVAFGLKVRKTPEIPNIQDRVREILGRLQIEDLAHRSIDTLSGGEKQRVALARALVLRPHVLLLDEPLSALDTRNKMNSIELLRSIHRDFCPTIVHVTHDHQEALALADRVAIMHEGSVIHIDKPREVFQRPQSRFVADFLGAENLFEGTALARQAHQDGSIVQIGENGRTIRVSTGERREGKVNLMINPGNIVVSKSKFSSSMRNVFSGRVIKIDDINHLIKITVDTGVPFRVSLTKQAFDELDINIGSELFISFKASATHLF